MRFLGKVVLLQAQRESLKIGAAPRRRYDPAPLLQVRELTLTGDGVEGATDDGGRVLDVHNRTHPASKHRDGANGLSLGFTAHYRAMRERFGDHLGDGIAGENVLIETDKIVTADDLRRGVMIETSDGELVCLDEVIVAAPCVEFARYALRLADDVRSDRSVTEALQYLDRGMRGFYAVYRGPAVSLSLGAKAEVP